MIVEPVLEEWNFGNMVRYTSTRAIWTPLYVSSDTNVIPVTRGGMTKNSCICPTAAGIGLDLLSDLDMLLAVCSEGESHGIFDELVELDTDRDIPRRGMSIEVS